MTLRKILKEWTLPIAMATGSVAYLLFAFVPALDEAAAFFDPIFDALLPVFMFFILLVTFCKVNFRRMRPARWHLWISIEQVLVVAMMVGAILWLGLEGKPLILAEGLLTCVIAPTAAAAAVVTAKLGGDMETMTTYTFISNLITAMLVPIAFPLVNPSAHMDFFSAFLIILNKVCLVLVVPMLLAYLIKHYLPKFHARIISVRDLSFYIWGVSLAIVTGTTVKHIVHAQAGTLFLLLIAAGAFVICLVQFGVGRAIGRTYLKKVEAGQALGQKNTAFAIWMAYSYLTPLSSVGPGCYILWQNIINSYEIAHVKGGAKSS